MQNILKHIAFWSFQILNTLTGFLMTFFPKDFHQSLFAYPQTVYAKLGFSPIAVEMVHNIIRAHGAALLAVSVFIWIERAKTRSVHLLIFIVCALSVYAHFMTLRQHLSSPDIVNAIGSFGTFYGTIAVTAVVGLLNAVVFFLHKTSPDAYKRINL